MISRRTMLRGAAAALPALYAQRFLRRNPGGRNPATGIAAHPGNRPVSTHLGIAQAIPRPDWFRDAKFGIWAHWSAQCQPEQGDWYARQMYIQGHAQNKFHVQKYGHPSKFGFMEIDNLWKAENWDPEALMDLYVKAGAKYFVSLANHHDNFDNYDSTLSRLELGERRTEEGHHRHLGQNRARTRHCASA